MLMLLNGSAWVPSEQSTELAQQWAEAIDRIEPRKVAAGQMGVSEASLSEMLAGRKPFHLGRAANLPVSIWGEFVSIKASQMGMLVLRTSELQQLVNGVRKLVQKECA